MAARCTYHRPILMLAAKQEPYKKPFILTKNNEELSGGKISRIGQQAEKTEDRKNNKNRQKNKRGDSKVELIDSPEIPDRGETSDIPGPPSGASEREKQRLRLDSFWRILGEDTSWPHNVDEVQTFLSGGFVWLFYQYLCNSGFKFELHKELWFFLYQ